MKIEAKANEQGNKYPRLVVSPYTEAVAMLFSPHNGVVILGKGGDPLGSACSLWDDFKPYDGVITLSND